MFLKKRTLAAVLLAAAAVPSFAMAQDTTATPAEEPAPNTGAFHFGADLFYTTSYFFRGYNQEDTGLIFQPNVYATFNALTSDDVIVDLKVGSWNSLHENQTISDGIWYENDLYALATVNVQGFKFNVGYTLYTYPDDAFESIHEIGVSTGFDDTKLWEKAGLAGFTLNPELGVYFETDDGNGSEDIYAELKLTPAYQLDLDVPVIGKGKLSLPMILGMSLDDYYLDSDGSNAFFGYLQVGAAVSVPLDFIPAKYGTWSATGGINYIHMLADSTELANDGGTDYELQGVVGISMTY